MDVGWKVMTVGASLVSGVVANKMVDVIWHTAFHKSRPKGDDLTEPLRDAIVFAVVSSTVAAVVNQVVMRRTAKWYGLNTAKSDGSAA